MRDILLSGLSFRFRKLSQSYRQVTYVLLTRPPLSPKGSFDLHVLGTPPAFVLSQDQTLHFKRPPSFTSIALSIKVDCSTFLADEICISFPCFFIHSLCSFQRTIIHINRVVTGFTRTITRSCTTVIKEITCLKATFIIYHIRLYHCKCM